MVKYLNLHHLRSGAIASTFPMRTAIWNIAACIRNFQIFRQETKVFKKLKSRVELKYAALTCIKTKLKFGIRNISLLEVFLYSSTKIRKPISYSWSIFSSDRLELFYLADSYGQTESSNWFVPRAYNSHWLQERDDSILREMELNGRHENILKRWPSLSPISSLTSISSPTKIYFLHTVSYSLPSQTPLVITADRARISLHPVISNFKLQQS